MNRTEAARNATRVRMEKKSQAIALRQDVLALRAQVGSELGRLTSCGLRLNYGDIDEEYAPALKTLAGRTAIYEQMVNSPIVRGQLTAITMTLISGVRWKVEGGTQEMQDLVAANLLRQGPKKFWCATSWIDRLYETLGCLVYGFALFAKERENVENRTIFRNLKWLHPRSVDEAGWIMDDADNLTEVRRNFRDGAGGNHTREPIPARDLFVVPWDRRGPNWEGNAFIRPMYGLFTMSNLAAKIDLIDLQNRGVGIPMAKLSGAGGPKEKETLVQILKDLRGGDKSRAFIAIEKDEDVKFLTSEGLVREASSILDRAAADAARIGGGQYLESGNTQSGSRAASSSMATGFFIHVDAIRIILEEIFNFGAGTMPGLVEELIDMNWEDVEEYPRIVGSRVSPTEQLDNIPMIADCIQKGAITKDIGIENEVRRRLNYPEIDQSEFDRLNTRGPAFGSAGNGGGNGNGGAGRPDGAGTDAQGRDDTLSRQMPSVGLAQKKTPGGGSLPMRSRPSYRWLTSNRA